MQKAKPIVKQNQISRQFGHLVVDTVLTHVFHYYTWVSDMRGADLYAIISK
jgi:hypothetical protein